MLAKAPTLAADELVLDLEDAVEAGGKDRARSVVVDALASEPHAGHGRRCRATPLGQSDAARSRLMATCSTRRCAWRP